MAAMTHVFPTYDRFGFEPVSGQGVTITDETGKQYLDFTSGIGVCNLGYQHPAVTQAVSDQLARCGISLIFTIITYKSLSPIYWSAIVTD